MALYAFDGTGNQDEDDATRDSNVAEFFSAYSDPNKNTDPDEEFGSLYLKGIGRLARTLVGMGVAEAFEMADTGGWSRRWPVSRKTANGATTSTSSDSLAIAAIALSFANVVASELPSQLVRFMGLFDVVGQFGLPGRHVQAGHILTLPPNVKCCRHAMALDESRVLFPLTRLCDDNGKPARFARRGWFRGVHSDVGGGNGNRGLNWIPLHWMFINARRAGLPIDQASIDNNLADRAVAQQISDHRANLEKRRTFFPNDCLHSSVFVVDGHGRIHNNPPMTLRRMNNEGVDGISERLKREVGCAEVDVLIGLTVISSPSAWR